jgi:integrase/recombinase XerD
MEDLSCHGCGHIIHPAKESFATLSVRMTVNSPSVNGGTKGGRVSSSFIAPRSSFKKGDLALCVSCTAALHLESMLSGKRPLLSAEAGPRTRTEFRAENNATSGLARTVSRREGRYIPIGERKAIYAACLKTAWPIRNVAMIQFSKVSGLRVSELLSLNIGQIWDGSMVRDVVELKPEQTKGKKRGRPVQWRCHNDELRRTVDRYLRDRRKRGHDLEPNEPLWVSLSTGKRLTRARLDQICDQVTAIVRGDKPDFKKFKWHDLRRTCATDLHKSGAELDDIQDVLGHTSAVTTRRYIMRDPADSRLAVAATRA